MQKARIVEDMVLIFENYLFCVVLFRVDVIDDLSIFYGYEFFVYIYLLEGQRLRE